MSSFPCACFRGRVTEQLGRSSQAHHSWSPLDGQLWTGHQRLSILHHHRRHLVARRQARRLRPSLFLFGPLRRLAEVLDGKQGKVIEGMEHVTFIENVPKGRNDKPAEAVTIADCGEVRDPLPASATRTTTDTASGRSAPRRERDRRGRKRDSPPRGALNSPLLPQNPPSSPRSPILSIHSPPPFPFPFLPSAKVRCSHALSLFSSSDLQDSHSPHSPSTPGHHDDPTLPVSPVPSSSSSSWLFAFGLLLVGGGGFALWRNGARERYASWRESQGYNRV